MSIQTATPTSHTYPAADNLKSATVAQESLAQILEETQSNALQEDAGVADFLKFVNGSSEKRFIENWLTSHQLTQEDMEAMSSEKRAAIIKEIEAGIKTKVENTLKSKTQMALLLSLQATRSKN